MLIKTKELLGKKVVTRSGSILGKVADFEVDSSRHSVVSYQVQGDLLGLKAPLMVHVSQVLEINEKEMVVEDAVVREGAVVKEAAPAGI